MGVELTFFDDPAEFLRAVDPVLAADPLRSTVLASVTSRVAERRAAGHRAEGPEWWAVVSEDGVPVSAAMRSEGGRALGAYVLSMSDTAAVVLGDALAAAGGSLPGVNGALPASRIVAEIVASATGRDVHVKERVRLHVLEDLIVPRGVGGCLRAADASDLPLVTDWLEGFEQAAAEQAGRTAERSPIDEESLLERLARRHFWLWVDRGDVVHLTGHNPAFHGVARVGPVFTPPEHRGRGYARAAVAAVCRRLADQNVRVCLFTDVDNPTSNDTYAAIGFVPVVDQANHVLV